MRVKGKPVELIAATPRHLPLIERWLGRADIRRGWSGTVQNVQDLRAMIPVRGRAIHPYMITLGKPRQPIGFVQVYDSRPYVGDYLHGITPNGYNIDLLIADRCHRGSGIGSWVICEARKRALREAGRTQQAPAIYAFVFESNKASARAFEKNGYSLYKGQDAEEIRPDTLWWRREENGEPNEWLGFSPV